ncbi:hypothetical protein [Raoultella planticola]|uniref:hypothetical protein n=1 Tax=Raoultella planticola TaxID=575 RepID=UPI000BFE1929|nr:hypothetical protein [Raoultella planticola]EKV8770428.1 hypothetical protein [Klebsiella variicola]NHJ97544.1 hypothetical protein [Klebsiella quasipneumoniae subsp. similipneumoniae]ATM05101.1 hypothetical protein CRT62_10945 [Raoultella planticola]ATM17693.1 hypothetical protein CRN15_23905 [Raoultella planticola]EKW0519000.1 hypothetical protein [Klebsiella variicola]
MSKFEEICAAYKVSRDNFHAYRNRSMDFALSLGHKYIQYLGITKENFRWVPEQDSSTEKEGFTIPGAMHLDDDTYWHLGLKIKIFTAPNVFPQQELLIIFKFKEKEEKVFEVMIDNVDKKHDIEIWIDASYTVFFNHLQEVILAMYQDGLDNFLASQQENRKIGFI